MWVATIITGFVNAQVTTQEALNNAISSAEAGETITLGEGTFYISGLSKDLIIVGQGMSSTKVVMGSNGDGNQGTGIFVQNLTLKNMSLNQNPASTYTGFTGGKNLRFENVQFDYGFSNWGNTENAKVEFVSCTFNQAEQGKYCVQELRSGNGTSFLFDACTFECTKDGRFINAYKQGGQTVKMAITCKDCEFNNKGTSSKAVFNLKDEANGCTIDMTFVGTSTTTGAFPSSAPSALFQTTSTGWGTVYLKDDDDAEPIKIYENNAKTASWIDPNGYTPTSSTPAVYIPETLVVDGVDESASTEEKDAASDAIKDLAKNDNVNADDANNVTEVDDVTTLAISVANVTVETSNTGGTATATVTRVTFDVQPMNGEDKVNETAQPITFRLPVPQSFTNDIVKVSHNHNGDVEIFSAFVKGTGAAKYVELASTKFSEWTIEDVLGANLEIKTASDLVAFSTYVNAGHNMDGQTVKLANDIDMSGIANFTPISTGFAGTFDGLGYTISNLTVSASTNGAGLFGSVFGATIKNVKLANAVVINTAENYAGQLVGNGYAHIENCEITGGSVTGVDQVGAVIGYLSCGYVKNCTVDGVTVTANGDRAGGITGKANVDSQYDIVGNTVKNSTISAAKKVGEMRSAAGLVGQIMASALNHWVISDNDIINVTTKTLDKDELFVPVGEFRSGSFQADAVTGGHIVRNHWAPATTPDSYTMVNPNNAEQSITLINFYAVAQIEGGLRYASLAEAVAAAEGESTIILLANNDVTTNGVTIAAGKDITLDLNGYNIKAGEQTTNNIIVNGKLTLEDKSSLHDGKIYTEESYSSAANMGVVRVDGGEFVMNSGNIEAVIESDPANKGQFGVVMWDGAKVTINGGQIKAGWYTIANNGTDASAMSIIVNGGELISTTDYAIYQPAKNSSMSITNGIVYGAAGAIAANGGTVNVTGGTITSKGQGSTGNWGDGTGGLQNAAIIANAGYNDVAVTISGGTITAEGNAITLANGTIHNGTIAVSGGTFSSAIPDEYCADGFVPTKNESGTYGVTPESEFAMVITTYVDGKIKHLSVTPTQASNEGVSIAYSTAIDKVVIPNALENVNITYQHAFGAQREAWYVPFDYTLSAADCSNYEFSKIWSLKVDPSTGLATDVVVKVMGTGEVLKANTPYIVRKKVAEASNEFTVTGAKLHKSEEKSIWCETTEVRYAFEGLYQYRFQKDNSMWAFNAGTFSYTTNDDQVVTPLNFVMRMYDKTSGEMSVITTPGAPALAIAVLDEDEDDTPTGIRMIYGDEEPAVSVLSTHVDDNFYDLTGRRVAAPVKGGIYIHNGKKIIK